MSLENYLAYNRRTTTALVDPFKNTFKPYVKPHTPAKKDTVDCPWSIDVQESELTESQAARFKKQLP
jgi:hypothetical protein